MALSEEQYAVIAEKWRQKALNSITAGRVLSADEEMRIIIEAAAPFLQISSEPLSDAEWEEIKPAQYMTRIVLRGMIDLVLSRRTPVSAETTSTRNLIENPQIFHERLYNALTKREWDLSEEEVDTIMEAWEEVSAPDSVSAPEEKPKCVGYPACDGKLPGESHSCVCPKAEQSAQDDEGLSNQLKHIWFAWDTFDGAFKAIIAAVRAHDHNQITLPDEIVKQMRDYDGIIEGLKEELEQAKNISTNWMHIAAKDTKHLRETQEELDLMKSSLKDLQQGRLTTAPPFSDEWIERIRGGVRVMLARYYAGMTADGIEKRVSAVIDFISPKKTPEERVTVQMGVGKGLGVFIDGVPKEVYFGDRANAETFRLGLIAQLKADEK